MSKNLPLAIFAITTFLTLSHVSYAQAEEIPLSKRLSLDLLNTCKISMVLCKKEDLLPEHLDIINRHSSEVMLNTCKTSIVLCKKENLLHEHLVILNWHSSEAMLNTCKMSIVLCKKEDLLPEHLDELGEAELAKPKD